MVDDTNNAIPAALDRVRDAAAELTRADRELSSKVAEARGIGVGEAEIARASGQTPTSP